MIDPEGRALLAAAKHWWKGRRPVGWRLNSHRRNPTINCVDSREARLARAVVKCWKVGER